MAKQKSHWGLRPAGRQPHPRLSPSGIRGTPFLQQLLLVPTLLACLVGLRGHSAMNGGLGLSGACRTVKTSGQSGGLCWGQAIFHSETAEWEREGYVGRVGEEAGRWL